MYKAVIWDLDGTLLNTLGDLAAATNYALEKYGYPPISNADVRQRIGNGLGRLIALSVPEGADNPHYDDLIALFKEYYPAHCTELTEPYEGIVEIVEKLHDQGVMNAIVSNKIDSAVQLISRHYFHDLMDVNIGERAGVRRKPDPESLLNALKELNVDAKDAIYIGDSDVDIITAKNASMDHIAVSYGYRDREVLQALDPMYLVDNTAQLKEILCR